MGQALYRKYRPKNLGEIVGQEHVTTTLANALKNGRVSHAYLLTGPRGTGKTSIARILAHEINGLEYDDEAHLDIIEIDAASNRRIDEMRDLRDRVSTAPANAKYKVYIIDEVHMLTKEAFNALLKTLEEPPAHVVFILATTEAHKLPETIISRTQRYSFRPVPQAQVIAHLKNIAKSEKVKIDDAALELIAAHGEGSFRDSISLLDQASNTTSDVTRADVEQILGLAPAELIATLRNALEQQESTTVVTTLASIYAQGYEPAMIAVQLGEQLRTNVLEGTLGGSMGYKDALQLLQRLLEVPAARSPKQLLELILLEAALKAPQGEARGVKNIEETPPAVATPKTQPAPKPVATPEPVQHTEKQTSASKPEKPAEKVTETKPAKAKAEPAPDLANLDINAIWQQTLDEIKKQYNTLYGIARMAAIELDGNKLTVHLKFAFHQKRLNEVKNRKIFDDILQRISGKPLEMVCVVAEGPVVAAATPSAQPDVSAISNIFGGAELLES